MRRLMRLGLVMGALMATAASGPPSTITRTLVWQDTPGTQLPDTYVLCMSTNLSVPMTNWWVVDSFPAYTINGATPTNSFVSFTYQDAAGWKAVLWDMDGNAAVTNAVTRRTNATVTVSVLTDNFFFLVVSNSGGMWGPSNLATIAARPGIRALQIR